MNLRLILIFALALLVGCETAPGQKGSATFPWLGKSTTRAEQADKELDASVDAASGTGKTDKSVNQSQAPALTGEAARTQSHKLTLDAVDLLDQGKEDEAKAMLQQALDLDRQNKFATSLMRQIVEDPEQALGSKSFKYTVRPGETLSIIAQRYMGDLQAFYGLARYNDIRVPREVHAGQVIRVPGDQPYEPPPRPKPAKPTKPVPTDEVEAPPPPAPAPPLPQENAEAEAAYSKGMRLLRGGQKDQAYTAFQQVLRLDPDHKLARAQSEQLRRDLIERHSRIAMGAFHRQDLTMAIKEWDKVLALDPQNESARLKRQQAVELSERIKNFPAR